MRYLVIHSKGYGGEGPWFVNYEIEADNPDAPVEGVFEHPGVDPSGYQDAKQFSENNPELDAGDIAMQTGGQFLAYLAEKETGKVVFDSGEHLSEQFQLHWETLNDPSLEDEDELEAEDRSASS